MGYILTDVKKNSLFYRYGLKKGDEICAINDISDFDIIDYMLATGDTAYKIDVIRQGIAETIFIENAEFDLPGACFENVTIDSVRRCKNKCIFCFMDQMPNGMRDTLYFKDDDYRLSFLEGNYITLTNVADDELKRIARLKLSPLNISVHTTNASLRERMMNNNSAGKILEQIKYLAQNDITMNIQLVLCSGINDGNELKKSLSDLKSIGPAINSLSCVPVGITRYRKNLPYLKRFDKESSIKVIETISEFSDAYGTFCASDEFFLLADMPIPQSEYYGAYDQYENGVGMLRSFMDDTKQLLNSGMYTNLKARATIVSGMLAQKYLQEEVSRINKFTMCKLDLICVKNTFFGDTITTAGLITGSDLINDVRLKNKTLILPSCMIKEDENIFLDDMSITQLEEKLQSKIYVAEPTAEGLIETLSGMEKYHD